jgi:7-cyano-7-deazaguanine synthase
MARKAVALLSGGLDSAVAAAIASSEGFQIHALTVDYGQRHLRELKSAKDIAEALGVKEHRILRVDLTGFGGSALTDAKIKVPKTRIGEKIGADIPATYVPARNTVLLGLGLAWAEALGADAVYIGAHSVDYSGYPDCRPEFLDAFRRVSALGTRRGVEGRPISIEAPLIRMGKREIIERGRELKVPFEFTWSCYLGGEKACGKCDSCTIRLKAFAEAGMEDPIEYERE